MSKILQTQLPLAYGETTSVDVFNRLVRILEINLGAVDPDNTLQLSTAQRDKLNFNLGTLIFNTTTQVLQVFNGTEFIDLMDEPNPQGEKEGTGTHAGVFPRSRFLFGAQTVQCSKARTQRHVFRVPDRERDSAGNAGRGTHSACVPCVPPSAGTQQKGITPKILVQSFHFQSTILVRWGPLMK